MDADAAHPASKHGALERRCRRTVVAFWAMTAIVVGLVAAIVVMAITNVPRYRNGAFSLTVGSDKPRAVVLQNISTRLASKSPLPAGYKLVGIVALHMVAQGAWLSTSAAGAVASSGTPASLYLVRNAAGDEFIWLGGKAWLGAGLVASGTPAVVSLAPTPATSS